jgi:hypothetical protein
MDKVLHKLASIEFIRGKETIFRILQRIKDNFMTTKDVSLFCIPSSEDKFTIFLKEFGEIDISKQTIQIMDPDEIDRDRYFKVYLEPFTKSISAEFL